MHEMIIYWSEEDNCYLVEVPKLLSYMADGKTRSEAVSNAEVIISEWIEIAKQDGKIGFRYHGEN